MTSQPRTSETETVTLSEAAQILGLNKRAAETALRHAGIRSGYPRRAVEWLRDHRPGRGARTDLRREAMTNEEMIKAQLVRFEQARRVLGHIATLAPEEVQGLPDHDLLIGYARLLLARQEEMTDPGLPRPVLPTVDVTLRRVTHETCTGNTEMYLNHHHHGGGVTINRKRPFDPDSGRDVALAWLADMVCVEVEETIAFRHAATPQARTRAVAEMVIAGMTDEAIRNLLELRGNPLVLDEAWAAIQQDAESCWSRGDDLFSRAVGARGTFTPTAEAQAARTQYYKSQDSGRRGRPGHRRGASHLETRREGIPDTLGLTGNRAAYSDAAPHRRRDRWGA